MAVVDHHGHHHEQTVNPDFVRDRARGWEAFTRFMTYATGATVAVLVLMAIFLL